jgi:putative endonuclease
MGRLLREVVARYWPFGPLGPRGEGVAALFLRRQGLSVVARNVRVASGEIDLVALDGPQVVFVEVKSRTVSRGDERTGLERIDRKKRASLRRACGLLRKSLPGRYESYRIDGVSVEFRRGRLGHSVGEVRWYPSLIELD